MMEKRVKNNKFEVKVFLKGYWEINEKYVIDVIDIIDK